jgi:hypothetical protein
MSYFFLLLDLRCLGACAKSDAATRFSDLGVWELRNSLPAKCAGRFPVAMLVSPCPCGKREKLLERAVMATAPSLDQQVVVDAMAPSSVSR